MVTLSRQVELLARRLLDERAGAFVRYLIVQRLDGSTHLSHFCPFGEQLLFKALVSVSCLDNGDKKPDRREDNDSYARLRHRQA
jgi:hypothetical protein